MIFLFSGVLKFKFYYARWVTRSLTVLFMLPFSFTTFIFNPKKLHNKGQILHFYNVVKKFYIWPST